MSDICCQLHRLFTRQNIYSFPYDERFIPLNGIYVLFEEGEHAHEVARVVRIGTHRGDDNLPSRIREHYCTENKDRSIFRKNIGRALLNRDYDPFWAQWELDLTSHETKLQHGPSIDQAKLRDTERRVSTYIRANIKFAVFGVEITADRKWWEEKLIGTVSRCRDCSASPTWLGLSSPKQCIRESGLWLQRGLYKEPLSYNELELLTKIVSRC